PVKGKRPVLSTCNGREMATVVRFQSSHIVFEGFEVTSGGEALANRGIRTVGDDITIRNVLVHDVPGHGILGSDSGGSVTLSSVEVHHCGKGQGYHQVYFGADNVKYPGATLRVEHCHFHDSTGGIDLKTRVARTELYYNWIEGNTYYLLDLI